MLQRFDYNIFSRRSYRKAYNECKIYLANLYKINGFSFCLVFPAMRSLLRLFHKYINRMMYLSNFQYKLFKTDACM